MGENKEIKVRLSTVVCVFIILVLVVALGAVYYLGFVKNDNANNMIVNGEVVEKNNISLNEQLPEINNNIEENVEDRNEELAVKNNIASNEQVTEENSNENQYTYEKIKGLYTYTNEESAYSLYLWENGTFKYENFFDSSDGYGGGGRIGNYIIEDNVIKLNYMFSTGTDASLTVTKGNKELKIDAYDRITFTDEDFNNNKILLKKDNNNKEDNELYDFYHYINEYIIFNKYTHK